MTKVLPASHASTRGIALLITLALLALITILVVGFTVSMRTERQASHSMGENERAKLVSQAALAHAVALLDNNIPQPVAPVASPAPAAVNWTINPGLLTTISGNGATQAINTVPLSSNPSTGYQSTAADANLNVPLLTGTNNYTILSTGDPMRVAWVPLLQNPAQAASAANPISARYAFWIDDESAKINVNTALGKPVGGINLGAQAPGVVQSVNAKYPIGHPASVNLDVFGETLDAAGLARTVTQLGPLASINDLKPFVTGYPSDPSNPGETAADVFIAKNGFHLTTWSRAPEFNAFGKSRLFLLRGGGATLGKDAPYFQFFRDLDAPVCCYSRENLSNDGTAVYYSAKGIANYLNRRDWPGMPATSFVDKWSKGTGGATVGLREADQVAWNIIARGNFSDYSPYSTLNAQGVPTADDYFRADNIIPKGQEGAVGTVNVPNAKLGFGPLSGKAIMPAFPLPFINEVCLQVLPVSGTVKVNGVNTPVYFLKLATAFEYWLPPGYAQYDCTATFRSPQIGLTYLYVNAVQGSTNVTQEDVKYYAYVKPDGTTVATGTPNGIPVLYAGDNADVIPANGYVSPTTAKPFYIHDSTTQSFSNSTTGATPFDPTPNHPVTITVRMRLFSRVANGTTSSWQLAPVWDKHDPGIVAPAGWNANPAGGAVSAFTPPADDPNDFMEFKFTVDLSVLGGSLITRSLEVADPRTAGLARTWVPVLPEFNQPATADANTLRAKNRANTMSDDDMKKFAFLDFSNAAPQSPRPPIGMFATVPTGMQRGLVNSTFKLQPSGAGDPNDLPDWLLLDLLAPTVSSYNADSTGTPSAFPLALMNATAGKVNLNAAISPAGGGFTPAARFLPLQAVFQNMQAATTVAGTPPTAASTVVENILKHTLAKDGKDYGAPGKYDYLGELCEIAGVADDPSQSEWDRESLVRNLANTLTTQSNVFSVWGVSQTLKKAPGHIKYGTFETGDLVTGEKRFQAIVERYVWPGADSFAGNAHTDTGGVYDRLSAANTTTPGKPPPVTGGVWEQLDGLDAPTYPVAGNLVGSWNTNALASYQTGPLESALNPVGARMKYRVVGFRYLSE